MSQKINKKEDRRIRYTKMRIRTAFHELIQEMDHEKITVTAICNRAEINRATFYKYYLDVPDLVDKLQDETINELAEKLDFTAKNNTTEEFLIETLAFIKNNSDGHSNLISVTPSGASSFTDKISRLVYCKFSSFIEPMIPIKSNIEKVVVFSYIAAGSAGVIDYWIRTGYKENEKSIAKKISLLASATLKCL
ncbi:TetR/AcrR family transcriptional regulator [Butyrivibrio sp. AC2005]|uniref:TetR/AcrR family transcriptional regulator n=1 Tax=Butyrivibrio sp. AC2005 TaxID=1280672 RepID=UPI00040679F2|nr:TetR/AcrR family transcriptional regulator C-terminal domain-containing protein [Butyrivibrio sp. AC2005]